MKKFRATVTVKGSILRPPYTGHVDVLADEEIEIRGEVFRKLRSTSFPEISLSDVKIISTQQLYRVTGI